MITIPYQALSTDALRGVVEAFVLREGTDYGHRDYSLDEKVERVMAVLQSGRAEIQYDPQTEHFEIQMLD